MDDPPPPARTDPDPDTLPERPEFIRTQFTDAFVRHTIRGRLDVDQVVRFINRNFDLWADRPAIWDLSAARIGHLGFAEWTAVIPATCANSKRHPGRRVAIVSSEVLHDGMIRALELIAANMRDVVYVRAFQDMGEAEDWVREEA